MTLTLAALLILSPQAPNPLSADLKQAYQNMRSNILRSAEKMPEENYSFRPAPRVRTYGEILGHIAQEQYLYFCGPARGEQKAADIEKTRTSKADLLAALKESFAYCDVAYDELTDQGKVTLLWKNVLHDGEHYGNLVTYLRIKGLVPPSTEGN